MSIVIFITLLISIIGATGTPKLSRFFGFSSIYNATFIVGLLISWMQENPNIQYENIFFVSYIFSIFYTISTFVLFSIVEKAGVSSFEDIYYIPSNLRFYWLFFVANFIPFPLLLGFFAKLGIFIEIFKNGMSHIGVLFALSSVLAMYFYTRLLPIKEVPHSQNIPTSSMFRLCIFVLTTTFLIINLFLTKAYQLFTTLYKISLPYF
jgi:NADH:ubiquinone oxidoreductase subunit 2 (subunit N)